MLNWRWKWGFCIILCVLPISALAFWHGAPLGTYTRSITVLHAQVAATQSNFPVLVSGTYSFLAAPNTGRNVDVNQIGFYTGTDCATGKLNWEVDTYNAQTGAASFWVLMPTLSSTVDTVFYICYGNRHSADQSNAAAVWDANYQAVYHVRPGTGGFTRYAGNPVLSHSQAAWNDSQLEEPIVLTDPNNSANLLMFLGGMAAPVRTGQIYMGRTQAAAATPFSWTWDSSNPVLSPGVATWDGYYIRPGTVLDKGGGNLLLYYTGGNSGTGTADQIGIATSTDNGLTWTKYAGNPVLTPGGNGCNDGDTVSQPAVFQWTDGKYYMYYAYRSGGNVLAGYKQATSTDGLTWTKNGCTVLIPLGSAGSFDDTFMEDHTVTLLSGTIYVTYESEGDWSRYWTVNMASATSPGGPFTKSPNNPIYWGEGWLTNPAPAWDGAAVATPRWYNSTAGLLLFTQGGQTQNPYANARYSIGISSFPGTVASVYSSTQLSATDSTSNSNTATPYTTGVTPGLIGNALTGNGQGSRITTPLVNLSYAQGTIEWCQNPSEAYNDGAIAGLWGQGSATNILDAQKDASGNLNIGWTIGGTDDRVAVSAALYYAVGAWACFAYTWVSGGTGTLYYNGTSIGTHALGTVANIGQPLLFGQQGGTTATSSNFFGNMDEMRVSNTARSQPWLATQSANMRTPSSFYTVGPEIIVQ